MKKKRHFFYKFKNEISKIYFFSGIKSTHGFFPCLYTVLSPTYSVMF